MLYNRKIRTEAMEKVQTKIDGEDSTVDSPSLHKDDLLDDEDNEMSENESVGTQPEEVIDYSFYVILLSHLYLFVGRRSKIDL